GVHAPLTYVSPAMHAMPHIAVLQVGVPSVTAGHACPHAPQLAVSLIVSTHAAEHNVSPPEQVLYPHTLAAHAGVPRSAGHAIPQPPQFDTSAARLTSQPSLVSALQSANPVQQ